MCVLFQPCQKPRSSIVVFPLYAKLEGFQLPASQPVGLSFITFSSLIGKLALTLLVGDLSPPLKPNKARGNKPATLLIKNPLLT